MLTLSIVVGVLCFVLGAVGHEADMARNYKKDGDARAWFFEIKR